ncbi:hypothetical protein Godav_025764 [Gossypium davidsonii]|uniref:Uncharacterized protein n=1 Tax=Gossypium davidsonii TaxID=34287 RepID=A0A7J8TG33_GOSDV|nr:hypothetical protein [Gossypium davidsonii]
MRRVYHHFGGRTVTIKIVGGWVEGRIYMG